MTDIAKVSIEADTSSLKAATISLKNFQKVGESTQKTVTGMASGFNSVRAPLKTVGDNAAKAAPKMQGFGHQARMVSMQLSQVAQQGSVTGNYLQALAIQLPDLMLGFGALGIMIGAVAGSLASYFVNSARKAENASSTLADEIDSLGKEFTKLGVAQKELLRIKIAEEALVLQKNIQSLKDDIAASVTEFDSLSRALARGSIDALEFGERTDEITRKNKDLRSEIEDHNKTIKDRNDLLNQTAEKEEAALEAATKAADARLKLAADLQAVEQGQESPSQRALREAAERASVIQAAQDAELSSIKSYDQLKRDNAQQLADDLVAIAKREQAQKNQILTAGQQAGLGIVGGLFGQMAALAKEGGEKQFQNYKNLASAQASISTALAVANVYANPMIPFPFNAGLATTVGALGLAQVAMIQNQEYQGARAMGGQVEGGGSYLVGENGPEVLQLGSQGGSVTPSHALGSDGGNVTTVVNIAAGVTKAELEAFAPTIIKTSVNAVKQQMARGGTMSQAIGRRA